MSPIMPLQAVGYAQETTFGVFVSPTDFIAANSAQPQTGKKIERPNQMRGARGQVIDAQVGEETGVQLSADIEPEGIARLIAGTFGVGSDSVSGPSDSAYTHTLTPQDDLPSYSFEISYDEVSQLLSRQVVGCMVDSISIRAQNQALATIDATLIGQTEKTPTTPGIPSYATPYFPPYQPLDFSLAAIQYGGASTALVTDFTLGINNAVQRVFTSNQKYYVRRLVPTRRTISLTAGFDFVNLDQYNDWTAQTPSASGSGFKVTMTSGELIPGASSAAFVVEWDIRRIRPQDTFDLADSNAVIQANLTFSATIGVTGDDDVRGRLINSLSGALA